jgi:hypothetical protein
MTSARADSDARGAAGVVPGWPGIDAERPVGESRERGYRSSPPSGLRVRLSATRPLPSVVVSNARHTSGLRIRLRHCQSLHRPHGDGAVVGTGCQPLPVDGVRHRGDPAPAAGRPSPPQHRLQGSQRLSSCSAVRSSSPRALIVRAPSARRSRARTTEVISMIASIVGVGTASRRARSVKKTRL